MTHAAVSAYKEAKEAFVSQLQGGSIAQINAVSCTALTTYALWAALQSRGWALATTSRQRELIQEYKHRRRRRQQQHKRQRADQWQSLDASEPGANESFVTARLWLLEYTILIVPLILACTVLAERLLLLNGTLLLATTCIVMCSPSLAKLHSVELAGTDKQAKPSRKHWEEQSSSEEEWHDEDERLKGRDDKAVGTASKKGAAHVRHSSTHFLHRVDDPPLRVSVDSTGEGAPSAADSVTAWPPPGVQSVDSDSRRSQNDKTKAVHSANAEKMSTQSSVVPKNRPFLTVYRAHMMLMTIVCILAVDFPAFPRQFAKCESWGTSLMDLGVGSFVFSLGVVSAYPMLRSPQQRFKPMRFQLLRDTRRSLPLLALGSIRVIMVKGVDYPEHVTEYGVHWNFFITLALLPFFGTLCRPLARHLRYSTMGLLLLCLHQLALSLTSLGAWASSNTVARNTLLAQNKEGIVSLPGYAAIYLVGLDLGHYILPRDPHLAYRRSMHRRQQDKLDKLVEVLFSIAALWWSAFYIHRLGFSGIVSRRLANMAYVLWVSAYNTTFLLAYVTIYMLLLQPLVEVEKATTQRKGGSNDEVAQEVRETDPELDSHTPAIFRAINGQAFSVFLLANLLTGLVNMNVQTMYAHNSTALFILVLYVGACTGFASFAQSRNWRLKL